jgi:hypothetical protein
LGSSEGGGLPTQLHARVVDRHARQLRDQARDVAGREEVKAWRRRVLLGVWGKGGVETWKPRGWDDLWKAAGAVGIPPWMPEH